MPPLFHILETVGVKPFQITISSKNGRKTFTLIPERCAGPAICCVLITVNGYKHIVTPFNTMQLSFPELENRRPYREQTDAPCVEFGFVQSENETRFENRIWKKELLVPTNFSSLFHISIQRIERAKLRIKLG